MKVTLESTSKIVQLNDVPARVWEGMTEGGVPVFAFITRISPAIENPPPEVTAEFDRDLKQTRPPSVAVDQAIPARLVL